MLDAGEWHVECLRGTIFRSAIYLNIESTIHICRHSPPTIILETCSEILRKFSRSKFVKGMIDFRYTMVDEHSAVKPSFHDFPGVNFITWFSAHFISSSFSSSPPIYPRFDALVLNTKREFSPIPCQNL